MVSVDLQGGLGNQLFQYAVARALTYNSICNPILDLRVLRHDKKRQFSLSAYPITANVVDSSQLSSPGRARCRLAKFGFRTGNLRDYPFEALLFREDDSAGCWDRRIGALPQPVVLRGYFQSERYFSSVATKLRAELVPVMARCDAAKYLASVIRDAGPASVSVHVRRGDYANEPATLAFHGVLGLDFYRPALAIVQQHVHTPHFFVFADDIAAISALLPSDVTYTIISGKGLSDIEELTLMSACRHHVIANSSFSWWGAWLGHPNGLTIAPLRWFAKLSEASVKDRFPAHWVTVA